ncbi:MAG: Spy/CpxP family protein refolding chaperone [Candidatus Binatia bacterium]
MLYPGYHWWRARRHGADFGAWAGSWGCGPSFSRAWEERHASGERFADVGGGGFGVRRPLRYLAFKLDLDEHQVAELAKILSELKTERAQAEVDSRRTLAGFADAVGGEHFDESRAREAGGLRVGTAERLRDAVIRALSRIHTVLDAEQRERLAYLIRTGTRTICAKGGGARARRPLRHPGERANHLHRRPFDPHARRARGAARIGRRESTRRRTPLSRVSPPSAAQPW